MKPLDAVNAMLAARQYQELIPLKGGRLRLRSGKTFEEFAEQISYVLWNDLCIRTQAEPLDPHQFVSLTQAAHDVLSRRVDECVISPDPAIWDVWARTGGGHPTDAQTPPICAKHAERVQMEFGGELAELLVELEQAARKFIRPEAQAPLPLAVLYSLKPYLMKNLATRYCEDCERDFRSQIQPRRNVP